MLRCFVSFSKSWGIAVTRIMRLMRPMSHLWNILTRFQIIAKIADCTVAHPLKPCQWLRFLYGFISFFVGVSFFSPDLFPSPILQLTFRTCGHIQYNIFFSLKLFASICLLVDLFTSLFIRIFYSKVSRYFGVFGKKSKKHGLTVQMPF